VFARQDPRDLLEALTCLDVEADYRHAQQALR
jgi:hypothetical protein